MEKYNGRLDVPDKYKWDLSDFFDERVSVSDKVKELKSKLEAYQSYHGCTKNVDKLLKYLEYDTEVGSQIMDLVCYAYTKSDEDLSISENVSNLHLCESLETEYALANSFFTPEFLSLDKDEFTKLINDNTLKKYQKYLENIYRYKEHHLTEEQEQIVSLLTETLPTYASTSSTMLNSNHDYGKVTLENGDEETLTVTNYRKLMKKSSREKRKEIYFQFNKVLSQYSSTSAALLNDYFKTENAISKIYHFNNAWESKLFSLELSNEVFDSLVSSVLENKDVIKKYEKIKSSNIGVDELMPWDAPLEFYESKKEYTIEEGNNLILESLKPLGEDYIKHFEYAINGGNIDYCGYKGKCSGGYNISSINQKNSKILMSFNDDLSSVSTVAHEGGHHVNHQYLYEANDIIYREHSPIVAEVASLTNECLLSSYLSNSKDKDEALSGISNIVGIINSNLIGAVIEGNIEKKMYDYVSAGNSLTNEYLNTITEEEIKKYYDMNELKHEYQKNSWITRSHYYMHFYLYSYAICISVASYVAKNILDGNKEVLHNYLEFIKCGSDKKIKEAFNILGIDLTDKKVYIDAMKYLNDLLDKFKIIKDGE